MRATSPTLPLVPRRRMRSERWRQAWATLLLGGMLSGCIDHSVSLDHGFAAPPPEARPRTWWHWMNGNITADGATRDLAWMKRAGLGGVQLFEGSLGTPQVVPHRLTWMSPEWQAALKASIAEADRLHLDVQIATSPGWSAFGAPFVTAADGMKKLVWSRTTVAGGQRVATPLPQPPTNAGPFQDVPAAEPGAPDHYRDIAVLAFPSQGSPLPVPWVTDQRGGVLDAGRLVDARFDVPLNVAANAGRAALRFEYGQAVTVAAFTIGVQAPHGFGAPPAPDAILEASDDGSTFRHVATLPPNTATVRTAGFAPVTARVFRVRLAIADGAGGLPPVAPGVALPPAPPPIASFAITEARLATSRQIDHWVEKAGFATMNAYRPADADTSIPSAPLPGDVVDLSQRLRADGTVDWVAPPGRDWTVLRLGYSLTGKHNGPAPEEATGLEVDKLDPQAVRRYAERYLDLYRGAVGAGLIGRRGITGILSDSLEAGPQNWTPGLIAAFRRLRGYDPTPFLPALTGVPIGGIAASERFLWDYRQTLSDLLTEAHYGVLADVAHRRGLSYHAEALEDHRPSLGDDLAMRSRADVPMGAMWYPGGARTTLIADLQGAASVASVYGKRFVGSETFTIFGAPFAQAPRDLRATADLAFALGVNRVIIHTSPHQPFADRRPGMMLTPLLGQNFTRNETWAEMAHGWTDYLARSSWMLQQGRRSADVAWFVGEDAPVTALYGNAAFAGLPRGYTFDFVGPDGLVNALRVEGDGHLVSQGGARYRLLALDPNCERLSLAMVRRLAALVRAGAIVAGARPVDTPSQADDRDVWRREVDALWSGGRVFDTVAAALAAARVGPDWQASGDGASRLAVTHRTRDDADIWFVANTGKTAIATDLSLRVTGRAPEVWDAVSGDRRDASYRIEDGRTQVPVTLAAGQSTFLVFRKPAKTDRRDVASPSLREVADWSGDWTLSLGDLPARVLPRLDSWTTLPDPAARYFSGVGVYTRIVSIPATLRRRTLRLDLGTVADVAEVRVNSHAAGIVWTDDQSLPIGRWLKAGANRIEIRVANSWQNRLIGDAQPGATPSTFTSGPTWRADAPLRPSGLLSRVRLLQVAP